MTSDTLPDRFASETPTNTTTEQPRLSITVEVQGTINDTKLSYRSLVDQRNKENIERSHRQEVNETIEKAHDRRQTKASPSTTKIKTERHL